MTLWERHSGLVALIALVGLALDQALKLWLLFGYGLGMSGPVALTPFLDIVLVWNRGISYGLFQQYSELERWALAGFAVLATIAIWLWAAAARRFITSLSLALILAGAIGNGIDRLVFGAVIDFVHFHVGSFSWYVFNIADVWIVAGALGLVYDWATDRGGDATK
ncbi:signal peptidase II [Breoghania sp.]|uniref:signal peptidase II n=1 Tax=Breoghania sp. TaxID=2065378 RepID=UPI0026223A36|nr:signal peptidase II [Breoghania sp.]MDJ0930223.1 signal peptidase II [Breoghania sp.]